MHIYFHMQREENRDRNRYTKWMRVRWILKMHTKVDKSEFDFVPKYTTCINCKIKSMIHTNINKFSYNRVPIKKNERNKC